VVNGRNVIVSVYKKCDKTDCGNYLYHGISLFSTSYVLFNILPSWLILYTDKIIGDHQDGIQPN
jgi:hypothetical protein